MKMRRVFDHLKDRLVKAPILAHSDSAQALLSQVQCETELVVTYYKKILSTTEKNYCTTKKMLQAVVKTVKHFWPHLYWRTVRLQTGHASLMWLCKHSELLSQVACWLNILAEYSYGIEHCGGEKHRNADGMSCRSEEDSKQLLHIERDPFTLTLRSSCGRRRL